MCGAIEEDNRRYFGCISPQGSPPNSNIIISKNSLHPNSGHNFPHHYPTALLFMKSRIRRAVLRSLDLGACQLEGLPPSAFVSINLLTEVSLEGSFVTLPQARALVHSIAKGTRIKNFHLGTESVIDAETVSDALQNIDPVLIAVALNNVEYLCYNNIN